MKNRRLSSLPVTIAMSLHRMAEKDDPQVAPETLHLPEAAHSRFREKLFLYREANVLLVLTDRVNPSNDGRDPLFEPVLQEYERIIFPEDPVVRAAMRQSMMAALQDLRLRMHPPMGNRYESAREWSRNWFATIGHNELNPARLEQFSLFWSDEYTAVRKTLEEMVEGRT